MSLLSFANFLYAFRVNYINVIIVTFTQKLFNLLTKAVNEDN